MIDNLKLKLDGQIPITREELFILVNSWGRKRTFDISFPNITIHQSEPKECYDLSNLDVSNIEDLTDLFRYSLYNGDLSNWNVSNCKYMKATFYESDFNNDSLKNWDVSNVSRMDSTFKYSIFNGDISNWDISNIIDIDYAFARSKFDGDISKWKFNQKISCYESFLGNNNFMNKYNNGQEIPYHTDSFLVWFKENKKNISNLNISKNELNDIDNYLSSFEQDCEKKII